LYADIAQSLREHLTGDSKVNNFVDGAAISKEGLYFLECVSASASKNKPIDIVLTG
jgi:hypothetical protein